MFYWPSGSGVCEEAAFLEGVRGREGGTVADAVIIQRLSLGAVVALVTFYHLLVIVARLR